MDKTKTAALKEAVSAQKAATAAHEKLRAAFGGVGARPEVWMDGMVDKPGAPSWTTDWLRDLKRMGFEV